MKYAVIITYATGERTGATISAKNMTDAWEKVFEVFDKATVVAVEFAPILTPERAK